MTRVQVGDGFAPVCSEYCHHAWPKTLERINALSSAQARADKAESALTRAAEVLAEVEWAGRDMDLEYPCCPSCGGAAPDCRYAKEHPSQAGHCEECDLDAARVAIEEARKG
jgi:hypothetical protein